MRVAVLDGGVVQNFIAIPDDADPADFNAEVVPNNVKPGWRKTDPGFEPPRRDLEKERTKKQRDANRVYSEAMRPISDKFPPEEREGWNEQVKSSNNVKGGQPDKLVDALRRKTGQTAQQLADEIEIKRAEYREIYGLHTGTLRGLRKQIAEAGTLADLDAMDIEGSFAAAGNIETIDATSEFAPGPGE